MCRDRGGEGSRRLCPCRSLWDQHWNCHPPLGAAPALTPHSWDSLAEGGSGGVRARGGFGPVPRLVHKSLAASQPSRSRL